MNIAFDYSIGVIMMVAVVTLFTRALPFLLFGGKKDAPKWVQFIGRTLPPAIIAILVLYCFKDISITEVKNWLPQVLASAAVVLLHLWKKNTLLSVGGGTFIYMVLIQAVFI